MAVLEVIQGTDNGKGDVQGSLSWAILQANQLDGADEIQILTDVRLALPDDLQRMQTLLNSDITIKGNNHILSGDNDNDGAIDTNGEDRPLLFIKSGNINIENLTFKNGVAKGGDSKMGGGGLGAGGGLFVYAGTVGLKNVVFDNNRAVGGGSLVVTPNNLGIGGGGMGGNALGSGGAGMFGDSPLSEAYAGGYGGNGNYRSSISDFGGGGEGARGKGGFGGGGSYGGYIQSYFNVLPIGGYGGFGGGGGKGGRLLIPGSFPADIQSGFGGFGGGAGFNWSSYFKSMGGFGAGDSMSGYGGGGGAGLGGALFLRSGNVTLDSVQFTNNQAQGGVAFQNNGQGLGGAIFIIDQAAKDFQVSQTNTQGMPETLGIITGTASFTNNTAANAAGTPTNNNDIYGTDQIETGSNFGTAIDGLLEKAKVFFDANKNGTPDANEPLAITNASGTYDLEIPLDKYDTNNNGKIDPAEGTLVIIGGKDTSTGLTLKTPLAAPIVEVEGGQQVATSITKVVGLLTQTGVSTEVAQDVVKTGLGIAATVDLYSLNPLTVLAGNGNSGEQVNTDPVNTLNSIKLTPEVTSTPIGKLLQEVVNSNNLTAVTTIQSSSDTAAQVFGMMAGLQAASDQMSGVIDGASEVKVAFDQYVTESLLEEILKAILAGEVLDLTNAAQVESVICTAIDKAEAAIPELNLDRDTIDAIKDGVVEVMTATNAAIMDAAASGGTGSEIATSIAQAQKVAQSSAVNGLKAAAAGSQDIANVVKQNTGNALLNKIDKAEVQDPTAVNQAPTLANAIEDVTVKENTENYNLNISENFNNPAYIKSYLATGLPYGLKLDSATGVISGMPQGIKAIGDNKIAIFATNEFGTTTAKFELKVNTDNRGDSVINGLPNFRNEIYARAGNDTVNGNNFADYLVGQNGDDVLRGNGQPDTLVGGSGDDKLFGNDGKDVLQGGANNDLLFGGIKDDLLVGQNGDDVLDGAQGNDTLNGGAGEDRLLGTNNLVKNSTVDILIGGSNSDVFVLGDTLGSFYDDLAVADYALIKDFTTADDSFELFGTPEDYLLKNAVDYVKDKPGLAIVKAENNELIAILQGDVSLGLLQSSGDFLTLNGIFV